MNRKYIFFIILIAVSACALFDIRPQYPHYETIRWLDDSLFIMQVAWESGSYDCTCEEFRFNAKNGEVKVLDTVFPERAGDTLSGYYHPQISPDLRYVWCLDNDGMLTRYDLQLRESNHYEINCKSFNIDWENMKLLAVLDFDSMLFLDLNNWEQRVLKRDSLDAGTYSITWLYDVYFVKKDGVESWLIETLANDSTGDGDNAMLVLNREANEESAQIMYGVHGIPSPNIVYLVEKMENNRVIIYDSEGNLLRYIKF